MNKHDLRVIKTKKTVHSSLLALLKTKPITQIKVTELCKHAQVNRGTFYFHYQDIGDVLEELFEEIMLDLEESYAEPFKKGFDFNINSLNPSMIKIFHHVKKHEDFYKIVLSEDVPMKYYYMLFDVLCSFQSNEKYSVSNTSSYATAYSANAIIGLIVTWYRAGFDVSVDEMNKRLVEIVAIKNRNNSL